MRNTRHTKDGNADGHGRPHVDGVLVLRRHENEEIYIALPDGTVVKVIVLKIDGDRVRIGIAAPPDVLINRGEVWKHMVDEWEQGSR